MDTKNTNISLSIICIDVDPSIITYILSKPDSSDFSLDICTNLEHAHKKIASTLYDIYIIGVHIPESPVALIEEIKKREADNSSIVLILDKHFTQCHQSLLEEDEKIVYVFEKSNFKESVDLLFKEICERKTSPNNESKLEEIKRNYDGTIQQKVAHLTEMIKAAQENPELCKELNADIHKLSGSAGCFGYNSISEICKEKEKEITQHLADGTYKNREWLSSLSKFIEEIKQRFQIFSFKTSSSTLKYSPMEKPLLFIVNDDVNFLELVEKIKESFWVQLVVESDPKKAIELLCSPQFNPDGMIVSQTFSSSSISGFDILKVPSEKEESSHIVSAVLLDDDSIDARLEAMNRGADYVFCNPVSAYLLLKNMTEAIKTKTENPIKILLVDDDLDFCNYMIAILNDMGLTTYAINEGSDLFKKLEEFRPNILLLDLSLPKYDGMNLLKTLRGDILYKDLVIVIVTGNEQFDIINAYASNVDHILFKPIDPIHLQKHILSIIKKITENEPTNDYTGLFHPQELMDELNECFIKSDRNESTLALFEISNKKAAQPPPKDLASYISNQLQWEMSDAEKCFIYKPSMFAIIFEESRLENIQIQMYDFLTHLAKRDKKWNLSFNCGIVPISKKFTNVYNIIKVAEECLLEASKKGPAMVNIVQRLPIDESNAKKEVIIIDPNRDLIKILKRSFESRGVIVNAFSEGGDALKHLINVDHPSPALIIMERNLPDMDGIDLFQKLKSRFKSKIPFFILTVFSSDKDISDSIKMGVQEYITKPFNISILLQKSLQTIFKDQEIVVY
jgi:DNA-binding response OmpR family regulator/HPt (histidine-containing phosphotransfer) domain-containing protein